MNLARTIALLILLTAALPSPADVLWPEHFPYVVQQPGAHERNLAALKAVVTATVQLGFCPSVTSLGLLLIAGLLVAGLEMTEPSGAQRKLKGTEW